MTWFYNSRSGDYANESPPAPEYFLLEGLLHAGEGWHDYATQEQMLAAVAANHWPAPTTNTGTNLSNDASSAAQAAAKAAAGAVGSGFKLTFGNTTGLLGRILKIVLGGILVISGMLRLTGTDKAVLGAAGKAAVFA